MDNVLGLAYDNYETYIWYAYKKYAYIWSLYDFDFSYEMTMGYCECARLLMNGKMASHEC